MAAPARQINVILWTAVLSGLPAVVIAPSAETDITVQLEFVNGKWIPVIQKAPDSGGGEESGVPGHVIAAVFLMCLVLVVFIGNAILVGTIASSLQVKRLPFNVLLLNLGLVGLIECILNMIGSVVYLLTQPWMFGKVMCNLISYFMEFVPFIYTMLILTLVFDRAIALRDPAKYRKNLSAMKQKCYLFLYWVLSATAICPVAIGFIQSYPFPDRYSCQLMDKMTFLFGLITGSLIYVASWIAIVAALFFIHRMISAEKKKERKAMRGREQSNKLAEPSLFMFAMHQNIHFWNEVRNVALVVSLLVAYFGLLAPYVVRVKVDQITQEYDYNHYGNLSLGYIKEVEDENATDVTTLPTAASPSPPASGEATTTPASNETETNYIKIDETPEVREDFLGTWDTIVVWLRFIHAGVIPIIIFAIHKDLRKKTEDLLCCWRPNSVDQKKTAAQSRPISAYLHQKRREWEKKQKNFKKVANHNVPVLFASSEGLYLRLVDDNSGGAAAFESGNQTNGTEETNLDESMKGGWTVEPKFVMEMCDLSLPASAVRGRTPMTPGGNHVSSPNSDNNFGTTVTVIVGKREPNLKSSLKKPRPPRTTSSPDVDEGFVEGSGSGSDPARHQAAMRRVQFSNAVEEIPEVKLDEPQPPPAVVGSPRKKASMLPPLEAKSPSPRKSKKSSTVTVNDEASSRSPRKNRDRGRESEDAYSRDRRGRNLNPSSLLSSPEKSSRSSRRSLRQNSSEENNYHASPERSRRSKNGREEAFEMEAR